MSLPTIHMSISGSILALYGAVLSTATAVVQIMNHFRDRANVVLKVRRNMKSAGMGQRYAGMTMVIVTATNVGRRPVTISGFAAKALFGKGKATDWWMSDVHPPLPFEITEGREVSAFVNQATVDFDSIAYWYAWDSAGRHFRLNVAPWYKRWRSDWRWRHSDEPVTKGDGD
jgi:hypothetical protein